MFPRNPLLESEGNSLIARRNQTDQPKRRTIFELHCELFHYKGLKMMFAVIEPKLCFTPWCEPEVRMSRSKPGGTGVETVRFRTKNDAFCQLSLSLHSGSPLLRRPRKLGHLQCNRVLRVIYLQYYNIPHMIHCVVLCDGKSLHRSSAPQKVMVMA